MAQLRQSTEQMHPSTRNPRQSRALLHQSTAQQHLCTLQTRTDTGPRSVSQNQRKLRPGLKSRVRDGRSVGARSTGFSRHLPFPRSRLKAGLRAKEKGREHHARGLSAFWSDLDCKGWIMIQVVTTPPTSGITVVIRQSSISFGLHPHASSPYPSRKPTTNEMSANVIK